MKITTEQKNHSPLHLNDKSSLRQHRKVKPALKTAALLQAQVINPSSVQQRKNERMLSPLPTGSLLLKKGQKTTLPANSAKL